MYSTDSEVEPDGTLLGVHHFKSAEMLNALDLTVTPGGILWSTKDGNLVQRLSWSAEEAIAFTVGQMLDADVREAILRNAVVVNSEVEPE